MHINSLPFEILDTFFSYLPLPEKARAIAVCRLWRDLIVARPYAEVQKISRFVDQLLLLPHSNLSTRLLHPPRPLHLLSARVAAITISQLLPSRAGSHIKAIRYDVINTLCHFSADDLEEAFSQIEYDNPKAIPDFYRRIPDIVRCFQMPLTDYLDTNNRIPGGLRDDEDFWLMAASRERLRPVNEFSPRLQNSKQFLAQILCYSETFDIVKPEFWQDPDFCLNALEWCAEHEESHYPPDHSNCMCALSSFSENVWDDLNFCFKVLDIIPEYHYSYIFDYFPKQITSDPKLFAKCREMDIRMPLGHASEEIQDNPNIVLDAISIDAGAFHYASRRLKSDDDFICKAFLRTRLSKINVFFERFCISAEKLADKTFALKFAQYCGEFSSKKFESDPNVCLAVIDNHVRHSKRLPLSLHNNETLMMEAVRQNPKAIWLASEKVKKNRNILLCSLNGYLERFVKIDQESELFESPASFYAKYRDDIIDALDLLYSGPYNMRSIFQVSPPQFSCFDFELQATLLQVKRFAFELVAKGGFTCLSKHLFVNSNHARGQLIDNGCALESADATRKIDRKFVLNCIQNCGSYFRHAHEDLKNDRSFCLEVVAMNFLAFEHIPDTFKNDKNFVLEAVKLNGLVLMLVSDQFKHDPDIVLEATKQNPLALIFASDSLRNNKPFILRTVRERNEAFAAVPKGLKVDAEVQNACWRISKFSPLANIENLAIISNT